MEILIALGSTPAKTIQEAALVPEVRKTVMKWFRDKDSVRHSGVLIGGLALSFYARPRQTTDVDLLFDRESNIDVGEGFKRTRPHAAIDKDTHVELEFVTPRLIGVPEWVVQKVIQTAHTVGKFHIASLEAMIVLKLFGAENPKRKFSDLGDVQAMLTWNSGLNIDDLIDDWNLTDNQANQLRELQAVVES